MTALDDLRRQARYALKLDEADDEVAPAAFLHLAKLATALPDFEVPEDKVLVDRETVEVLAEWASEVNHGYCSGRSAAVNTRAAQAIDRLVVALPAPPVPEWEPSDELVGRYQDEFDRYQADVGLPVRVRGDVTGWLKRLYAAGLLNPEVTG